MKLNSLFVQEYKLLNNFSINFKKDVSILIGINGSGKSSILEVIAQIFSDAVLKEKSKFQFKIEYELRIEEILEQTVTSSEFKTEYIKVEISANGKDEDLLTKVLSGNQILEKESDIIRHYGSYNKILPSNIVIYYSGLSEIMKRICEPHDLLLSVNYRKGNTALARPFFYFEPPLFNLILITLLSYEFGDIPKFLLHRTKISSVERVTIRLKKPSWANGRIDKWWGAKGEVKTLLDLLDSKGKGLSLDENESSSSKGNVIIEAIDDEYLNINIVGQNMLYEIREYFVEETTFFKVLNTLLIDGLLLDVTFLFSRFEDNQLTQFEVLSEGEQQSIIVRGLIELVNNENTLFLFDEPDTYQHPSWQRNFIEEIVTLIEKYEYSETQNYSQFLITTHSPQLLSNAIPDKSEVQIMEEGEIVKITPKYYGRDISTILYEMMGVERRNKKVAKALSELFNLIEDEELEAAKLIFNTLANLIGEDDPAIVRARTQIEYLEESSNEAD